MNIYIAGGAQTKFGEIWDKDLRELAVEAAVNAINDAQVDIKDIDSIYVGNMLASRFSGQDHLGALIATELGLDVSATHIEAACASGGAALRLAWMEILSGQAKNVLVVGAEKMTDVPGEYATVGLSGASDEEWEASFGITFPSLYAMIARDHMHKYGTSKEILSKIAVKNHKHGSLNPNAQFPKEITLEMALNAVTVAEPLNLMDCSPISDGAAAVVLSSQKKSDVKIITSTQAQDSLALHDRKDISTLEATVKAGKRAFDLANITHKDIGLIELHDCFTIAELIAYEDLGFAKKGQGSKLVDQGITYFDNKLPVNTSGGLKSAGHPVGATGVKQAYEIYLQLSGKAKKRQIKNDAKYALSHNVGGSGATAVVTIYQKVN